MSYNLMIVSTCSPLYVSKLPDWHIHDSILKLLVEEYNVKLHAPIPQGGDRKLMERVYKGDPNPLYHTLRTLDIKFYPEMLEDLEFDGAFLEGLAFFQEVEVFDKIYTPQEQEDYLYRMLDKLVDKGKPILLMDNDFVCTQSFNGDAHVLERVYKRYKDYDNLSVISPATQYLPENVNFKRIPFPLDITSINPNINPVENREYICRYIGNNYYKSSTHIPVFNRLSNFGNVYVNGYRWSKEDKDLAPNVKFRSAVSLSHTNLCNAFGNSVLGVSGYSEYQRDVLKDLYHLRWKEFLIAGIYIVTEDLPELIDLMPKGNLVFSDFTKLSDIELGEKIDYIKGNYIKLVEEQRDCCIDWCRSDKLIKYYLEALNIE